MEGSVDDSAAENPDAKLTEEQLLANLSIRSDALAEELLKVARDVLSQEEGREPGLNAKGTSLLTAITISTAVTSGFAGLLLQQREAFTSLWQPVLLVVLHALALVLGMAAGVMAVRSLLVRVSRGIKISDVFGEILKQADAHRPLPPFPPPEFSSPALCTLMSWLRDETPPSTPPAPPEVSPKNFYARYVAAHYLRVADEQFRVHEERASQIKWGQGLFLGFLGCVVVIGIATSTTLYVQLSRSLDVSSAVTDTQPDAFPANLPPPQFDASDSRDAALPVLDAPASHASPGSPPDAAVVPAADS